jgi:hypothetical protein
MDLRSFLFLSFSILFLRYLTQSYKNFILKAKIHNGMLQYKDDRLFYASAWSGIQTMRNDLNPFQVSIWSYVLRHQNGRNVSSNCVYCIVPLTILYFCSPWHNSEGSWTSVPQRTLENWVLWWTATTRNFFEMCPSRRNLHPHLQQIQ